MNNKKIIIGVLVLSAVALGLVLLQKTPEQNNNNQPSDNTPKPFDPKNPGFIIGEVVSMTPYQLVFMSTSETYTAQIVVPTRLTAQVKNKSGVLTVAEAQPSEFKTGKRVVVYFSSPPKDKVYQADKIQMIDW